MAAAANILDQVWEPSKEELDSIYEAAAKKAGLNPELLKAQNAYEVGPHGNSTTAGDADHIGYGQLGPAIRAKYGVTDPTNPEQAITAQALHLRSLLDKHNGDVRAALTEYTGGPNSKAWGPHTLAYADNVLKNFPQGQDIAYKPPASGANENILDGAWDDEQAPQAPAAATQPKEPAIAPTGAEGSQYGAPHSFANGVLLGFGPQVHGALAAGLSFAHDVATEGLSKASAQFGPQYEAFRDNEELNQKLYARGSPLTDLASGLAGATASTIPMLMTGQSEVAAPMAARLGAAGKFLMGDIEKSPGARNWLLRRASQALSGSAAGAAAAGIQSNMSDKPLVSQLETGALTGGVLNPAIATGIEPLLNHISPFVARAANAMRNLGVDVRAGQVPGASPILRALNTTFGDGGAQARTDLTKAAAQTIGSDSPVLTRDVMNQAETRLRSGFENFANTAKDANLNDPVLQHDIGSIVGQAASEPSSKAAYKDLVTVSKIIGNRPSISGADYLQLTKRGSPLDRLMRDPEVGEHAINIRDALDDSLERQVSGGLGKWVPSASATSPGMSRLAGPYNPTQALAARAFSNAAAHPPMPPPGPGMEWEYNPEAQGLVQTLQMLRSQWKNLKTLDPIVDDVSGQIKPSALSAKVASALKRPSSRANVQQPTTDLHALGAAGDMIPDEGRKSWLARQWQNIGSLGHGGVMLGGLAAAHEFGPALEANWKPMLMGLPAAGLAYGMGKGANAFANSSSKTSAILARALTGEGDSPEAIIRGLTVPTVNLENREHRKFRSNGPNVEYLDPGETDWKRLSQ